MKRSPMPQRRARLAADPAATRAWQNRSRTRLPAMSATRAGEATKRRAAVDAAQRRDGGCTAILAWPEVECGGSLVGHEPGRRRGDGAHLDPDRIVTLCWQHHQAIHANVALAYERGFLIRGA